MLASAQVVDDSVSRSVDYYRKVVDDELWEKTASLSVIEKQIDRNLEQYDDLFDDWRRQRALAAALLFLRQVKALRAWRLWAHLQASSRRQRLKAVGGVWADKDTQILTPLARFVPPTATALAKLNEHYKIKKGCESNGNGECWKPTCGTGPAPEVVVRGE